MEGTITAASVEARSEPRVHQWVRKAPRGEINLYPFYGFSHASFTAVDALILVFAAGFLSGDTRELGLLDSMDNLGYTVGALSFGLLTSRLVPSRPLLAAAMILMAVPILLFAASTALWMAYVLSLLVGISAAVPNSILPWYLCARTPASRWAEVCGKLSAVAILGSAAGIVFSMAWLALAPRWPAVGKAEPSLFLIFGIATVVAALGVWQGTRGPRNKLRGSADVLSHSGGQSLLSTARIIAEAVTKPLRPAAALRLKDAAPSSGQPSPLSAFRDEWTVFSLSYGLLFLGLGMSFTATLIYLLHGLEVSGAGLFAFVLLFRVVSWFTASPAGRWAAWFSPLRLYQMAGVWRLLAVMALSLVAFLPVGPWSLVLIGVFLSLCGASSGVQGATSLMTATDQMPSRYQGMAIFLLNGVSNGAGAAGALLAGLIAQALGFPAVLASSGLVMGAALWLRNRY